jgi:hypothetical protein
LKDYYKKLPSIGAFILSWAGLFVIALQEDIQLSHHNFGLLRARITSAGIEWELSHEPGDP